MLSTDKPLLADRYSLALQWAFEKHIAQVRHNTNTPYISHLLTTSALVLEEGGDEDLAIAALLHDVLEDQPVEPSEVRDAFGDRVARIVVDCTDAAFKERPGMSWRERKRAHLRRMEGVHQDSLLVVAADKVASLQSMVDDLHRFGADMFRESQRTPSDLLWHYEATLQILAKRLRKSPLTIRLRDLIRTARGMVNGGHGSVREEAWKSSPH